MGKIVVIGGSLPGLAAALRLAKVGHEVTLVDKDTVATRWLRPESWPASLAVPAAWRDLFRKTGRTLEAELATRGLSLSPTPAPLYELPHRTTVAFPSDRATQLAVLRTTFSHKVAEAWQKRLDTADAAWQLLRRFGLESEEHLTWRAWRALEPRHTMADELSHVGEAWAFAAPLTWPYEPSEVPGWTMAWLAADRALGRSHLVDEQLRPQSHTVLAEILCERLTTRGVSVRTGEVTARTSTTVSLGDEQLPADAVIDTTNPWSGLSKPPKNLTPALAPSMTLTEGGSDGAERIDVEARTHSYCTLVGDTWYTVTWDYSAPVEDPSMGVAWRGAASWKSRPRIAGHKGVFTAHAANRAGGEPWAQILTGALAAYAAHQRVAGESIHPIDDPRKNR